MLLSFPSANTLFGIVSDNKFLSEPLIISIIAMLSSLVMVWFMVGVQYLRKRRQTKLKDVVRKKFNNQTIRLDGNKFVNCQFDACTIEYAGGDFMLDQSDIGEDCRIQFMTKESITALQLLYNYRFLDKHMMVIDQYGRLQKKPEML
jgi:hypothetical protein